MKKWLVIFTVLFIVGGCSAAPEEKLEKKERTSSSEQMKESKETVGSSSEAPIKLVEKSFEIEGTSYKIKALEAWQDFPLEENIAINVGNEEESEALLSYGFNKTDVESLDALKDSITEQILTIDAFQIEDEADLQKTAYQTSRYTGDLYTFTDSSEGVKNEIRYYFLETEADYVVINLLAAPAFFTNNEAVVTDILNSFAAE